MKKKQEIREIWGYVKRFDLRALLLTPTANGLLQFARYAVVGGLSTVVDWGILYLMAESGISETIAAICGYGGGLAANYLLSKCFVFKASQARTGALLEFIGYGVIGAVGLGLTLVIIRLLERTLGMHYMLAKAIATVIVLLWNYLARKLILYKK